MPRRVVSCVQPVYFTPSGAQAPAPPPLVTTPRSYFALAPPRPCFDFAHPGLHAPGQALERQALLEFPVACARVRLSGFFGSFQMALARPEELDFDSCESLSWGRLFFPLEDGQAFVQAGDTVQLRIARREGATYELKAQVVKQQSPD